jgi:1,2-diacylglycerol 3-beta-glucosyltransferase
MTITPLSMLAAAQASEIVSGSTLRTATFVVGAVVVACLVHVHVLALLGRSGPPRPSSEGTPPFFVFVVPCLNEERVLRRSLDGLLAMRTSIPFAVLVVDDGSDDGTAAIAQRYDPRRVWLLQRSAPDARQGKGAALNAAYRYLAAAPGLAGRAPDEVVVVVVDADGRVQPDALQVAAPYFARAEVGALQIGVRMHNADSGLLARLQDVEFVVFTEIFQQARRRLTSVGLGGNGQFVRLSALQTLGPAPWSDCLTEDLDLGIRLRLEGWISEYTGDTWVSQQALRDVAGLLRQRARWFHGHLQCLSLVPGILRAPLPVATTADLLWHLLAPFVVLLMSLWSAVFVTTLTYVWLADPSGAWALVQQSPWILGLFYVLAMAPATLYALAYRRRAGDVGVPGSFLLAHVFIGYGYLWFLAGWRAVWQVVRRQRGWAKTARLEEDDLEVVLTLPDTEQVRPRT